MPDFVAHLRGHAGPEDRGVLRQQCAGTARPRRTGSPTTRTSARALRDQDYLVWAVTHRDLDAFASGARREAGPTTVRGCSDPLRATFVQVAQKVAAPGSVKADALLDRRALPADRVPAPARPGRRGRAPPTRWRLALCHRAAVHRSTRRRSPTLLRTEFGEDVDVPAGPACGRRRAGARTAPSSRSTGGRSQDVRAVDRRRRPRTTLVGSPAAGRGVARLAGAGQRAAVPRTRPLPRA